MRYLLLDRVLEVSIDRSVRAVKNVALSEDVYSEHFFGYPVMPGALMIESLAQAGTVLLEVSCGWKQKALLVMVDKAKFHSLVRPGDQLLIRMTLRSKEESLAQLDGTIHVGETLVADARMVFALKEMSLFYPAKSRHLVDTLYDIWLEGASIVNPDGTKQARR